MCIPIPTNTHSCWRFRNQLRRKYPANVRFRSDFKSMAEGAGIQDAGRPGILETMPAPSAILAKSLLESKLAGETSEVAASTLPIGRMVHMANNAVNKWNFNWAPIGLRVHTYTHNTHTCLCFRSQLRGNSPASVRFRSDFKRVAEGAGIQNAGQTCILETKPAPSAILAKSLLESKLAGETSEVAASTLPINSPKTPPLPRRMRLRKIKCLCPCHKN